MRWTLSLLCAGLSFALLLGFGLAASQILPPLLEMLHTAPHLAMLGLLAFAVSPAVVIAMAHQAGSGVLDRLEGVPSTAKRGVTSLAAGAHGWLVLYGTSVLTTLVLLVVHPPELEPEHVSILGVVSQLMVAQVVSVHGAVWVGIATLLYELQRRGRSA